MLVLTAKSAVTVTRHFPPRSCAALGDFQTRSCHARRQQLAVHAADAAVAYAQDTVTRARGNDLRHQRVDTCATRVRTRLRREGLGGVAAGPVDMFQRQRSYTLQKFMVLLRAHPTSAPWRVARLWLAICAITLIVLTI
jgi:hypothetical protein